MNLRSKKIIIAGFGVGILIVGLFITVIGTILLPKFFEERAKYEAVSKVIGDTMSKYGLDDYELIEVFDTHIMCKDFEDLPTVSKYNLVKELDNIIRTTDIQVNGENINLSSDIYVDVKKNIVLYEYVNDFTVKSSQWSCELQGGRSPYDVPGLYKYVNDEGALCVYPELGGE